MKEKVEQFKELTKDPKGRTILFFGFYLLFFVVVILFVRFSSRNHTLTSDYERGNSMDSQIQAIENANYHYRYHIEIDHQVFDFLGERYQQTESFTYKDQDYYCNGVSCFCKTDKWNSCENPNVYHNILEPSIIRSIFEKATLDSKTSYESGKITYNYFIATDTLNRILYQEETDLGDSSNSIVLHTDDNQQLDSIIFQLDSYCKYRKLCQNSSKIEIAFDEIGEVSPIQNPAMN